MLESGKLTMDGDPESLVHYYLNAGLTVSGIEVFPEKRTERFLGTALRFLSISVLDTQNKPNGYIHSSEAFKFSIRYRVTNVVRNAQVGLILWNQDGVAVFTTTDLDRDIELLNREIEPGEYVTALQIPAPLLRAGRYIVELVSSVPGYRWLDRVDQAINFEIVDDGSPGIKLSQRRRGIIDPIYDWITEKVSDEITTLGLK